MAKKPVAKTPPAPTYPVNPVLEAAVIAHAEEDTPRLVYANW
ncbi:MAG: TIGR02996 domain-containing protein [Planctomycetes bacterium]|nr:TIGR02996 domain-containing protein [Planctomycetota bacterium]